MTMSRKNTPPQMSRLRLQSVAALHFQCKFPTLMNQKSLLLLALPLWLASCTTSMDLMGERAVESDEFYLSGGEPHSGDGVLEAARQQQILDQYAEYTDEYNDGYTPQGATSNRSNGRLWNSATSGYGSPFNSFGSGYGNYGGYSAFNPLNTGYGSTYGYNNMAFMGGYDAWGNPMMGGFNNPGYGMSYGNGWGYDPYGGGYWGTPGYGYFGGGNYGYHPHFGSLGAYNNPWNGGSSNGSSGGGISTFTPPRPRPNLGQFNGFAGGTSGSGSGSAEGTGNGATSPSSEAKPKPNQPGTQTGAKNRNRTRSSNTISLPASEPNRDSNYGRQSPAPETEPRPSTRTKRPNRPNRESNGNSGRSGGFDSPSRNQASPSPSRGGGSTRPSAPKPSAPRSTPRQTSGRSGRGG